VVAVDAVVVGLFVPLTAVLVVELGAVVVEFPVPLTAMLVEVDAGALVAVEVGLVDAVVGVAVTVGVAVLVVGALVPLAAVPDPLTVDALTVVEPDALTLPVPLFVAPTVVEPEALVVVLVVVGLVAAVMLFSSTGAAVPLAATPEPLTVDALTVVEPAAFTSPEPLLVALTVVEPDALVIVSCANAGAPNARLSKPALTAVAIVLLGCRIFTILCLLSG
jgi:hypothetical protein